MNLYTKTGDDGTTGLQGGVRVSKYSDVIQAIGALDELNAQLGIAKSHLHGGLADELEQVQKNIMTVMALLSATDDNAKLRFGSFAEHTEKLEQQIDAIQKILPKQQGFVIYGACKTSAFIDSARAVARRAETLLVRAAEGKVFAREALMYLNRLSDYLFAAARYADYEQIVEKTVMNMLNENQKKSNGMVEGMTLKNAKAVIEAVEQKAAEMGVNAVIACCNAVGNPVAVHVMDDAFLISYDMAMGKAYTAAALKMTTAELGRLAQPEQMFYSVEAIGGGKIVLVGGGVPVFDHNGRLLGGIGVSGGSAEQDAELAEIGLRFLQNS